MMGCFTVGLANWVQTWRAKFAGDWDGYFFALSHWSLSSSTSILLGSGSIKYKHCGWLNEALVYQEGDIADIPSWASKWKGSGALSRNNSHLWMDAAPWCYIYVGWDGSRLCSFSGPKLSSTVSNARNLLLVPGKSLLGNMFYISLSAIVVLTVALSDSSWVRCFRCISEHLSLHFWDAWPD